MPKRMLIDSSHPEETRVVVLDGQKVEEFDFEAATKRPLKGNIYLAKVTRVEPSLQAAFVEYGGNRQGFLAFSEIHPDYYQIPVADRMALLAEQEEEARRHAEEEFESVETGTAVGQISDDEEESESDNASAEHHHDEAHHDEHHHDDESHHDEHHAEEHHHDDHDDHHHDESHHDEQPHEEHAEQDSGVESLEPRAENGEQAAADTSSAQEPSSDQTSQPLRSQRPSQRWTRRRHYKIQEVIKRRQVILVQVVKEERGNKGAALTTYLSLAGRYCVLMPNTPRGGGISRKITNANDRKRLKSAAAALELPEGMGLIIRTAGENRTKVEIKRDYEYLLRMWDTIRELTLKSNAPACVYEEGDLIKRAIRDLYNKDVTEIIVEGDEGYRNAKDFMRMLMPSHAKNVKQYKEPIPLFQRQHIEAQLDAMFSPTVTLKSGGYIVINQTEALVSIDVNSGRATREHNIEDTAYKTNLEAAEEIGRQLRLRDLAGLIVIDFIDMEDQRNDRNVEKRIRDCVKNDRARIQIGKISQFGLLEMSRQRLRAGVVAGSTVPCPHCAGQGIVRSVESTALRVLRALDEEGQRQRAAAVAVRVTPDVAIYTLNQKRRELARIEADNAMLIVFEPKSDLPIGHFDIERTAQRSPDERPRIPVQMETAILPEPSEPEPDIVEEEERDEEEVQDVQSHSPQPQNGEQSQGENGGRRRRRRRRRGGRDRGPMNGNLNGNGNGNGVMQEAIPVTQSQSDFHGETPAAPMDGIAPQSLQAQQQPQGAGFNNANAVPGTGEGPRRKRRRRRGRRGRRDGEPVTQNEFSGEGVPVDASVHDEDIGDAMDEVVSVEVADVLAPAIAVVPNAPSTPSWSLTAEQPALHREPIAEAPPVLAEPAPAHLDEPVRTEPLRPAEPEQPARKGWWQRPFRRD
ncbi:MAG TPA: Rne/Rng family ribonuclease [Rhizomicrobium sp.]|nr:Rne/Rng family ribonuclease [Rhizomicrobium sp.]